ncbi:MAG: hypothetical protein ACQEUZ_03795 [Pseudomonadota bacterium]
MARDWKAKKSFDQLLAIIVTALAALSPCDRRVALESLVPLRQHVLEEILEDPFQRLMSGWDDATPEQRRRFLTHIREEDAA